MLGCDNKEFVLPTDIRADPIFFGRRAEAKNRPMAILGATDEISKVFRRRNAFDLEIF